MAEISKKTLKNIISKKELQNVKNSLKIDHPFAKVLVLKNVLIIRNIYVRRNYYTNIYFHEAKFTKIPSIIRPSYYDFQSFIAHGWSVLCSINSFSERMPKRHITDPFLMCLGRARQTVDNHIKRHKYLDAIDIILSVINTNSMSYLHLQSCYIGRITGDTDKY